MTLTKFILARIAEDEAIANDHRYIWSTDVGEPLQKPSRVLAECEAKRGIMAECDGWDRELDQAGAVADTVLRVLATIWADHPDYRPEEWA